MSCETVIGSIVALLDGELAGEERRRVEQHLAGCVSCRRERSLLAQTRGLISSHLSAAARSTPSFEALWQRIEAEGDGASNMSPGRPGGAARRRAERVWSGGAARRRWWSGAVAGMAAAAALALVLLRPSAVQQPAPTAPSGDPPAPIAAAPASDPAPAAVAAKPASQPATQVAKRDATPPKAADRDADRGDTQIARNDAAPADELLDDFDDDLAEDFPEESEALAFAEPDPPRDLLERPDLFLNFTIVRKLDELRHLDDVLAETPADPEHGGAG